MKNKHTIVLEEHDLLNIIKQVTKNETAKLVAAVSTFDADMKTNVELSFTIENPNQDAKS